MDDKFTHIRLGLFMRLLLYLIFLSHDTYLPYFIGSILVSGIVSSARLQLKAHTPTQIYAGFVIGFVISLSSAVFLFS